MKYIKIAFSLVMLMIILDACQKNLLEKYPTDEVSSAVFFTESSDMEIYLNHFYNDAIFPLSLTSREVFGDDSYRGGGDDFKSDNAIFREGISPLLNGTRTVNYSPGLYYSTGPGWDFTDVRSINYFFDNYKKCTAAFSTYQQYVGEAHFFRALIYFQLLQEFGDIPYTNTELNVNSPELFEARTPRNIVADNIIADLDSAVMYLPNQRNGGAGRVYGGLALALQSRVALYEGTWEKYHKGDPFEVSDPQPDKYFNKVVEAASSMMNSGLYQIYSTGHPSSDYYNLFNLRDYTSCTETLFWKQFSAALNITNERNYTLEYPFGSSLTKGLADSYLCTDGKPISGNPLFGGYNTITDEMRNRDPRFSQTIFEPATPWEIASDTLFWGDKIYPNMNTSPQYDVPTGYMLRKTYDDRVIYHVLNYEETPAILFRYAEVLLNFAEAKAELGTITQADLDNSIGLLRARVGMPNINLANIAHDPNWDFPQLSPIINEIRRERRVELATEGERWPDIARWAAADKLIAGKRPKGFKGSQIASTTFPVDADGFLDPFQASLPNGYGFQLNRDYLDPIPPTEIVKNPKLLQNPGW